MTNAKLAITSKKTDQYSMLAKPMFWRKNQDTLPTTLYATVISFIPSTPLVRQHRSLVLLTREKLPKFPDFPIFLEEDIETTIHSEPIEIPLATSTNELNSLTAFTLRIYYDVFHKTYDWQPEKMPYWLSPARTDVVHDKHSEPSNILDWDTLQFVHENEEVEWSSDTPPESLVDRFVFDHWDGRHRYFTLSIEESLRPTDPPPSFVPRRRHMDNIMSYSLSLSKNSRPKFFASCDWGQPVFLTELVRLRRNLLDRMKDSEKNVATRCVVCLGALKISAVR